MQNGSNSRIKCVVALYTSVWIEIDLSMLNIMENTSHSIRVCGLKLCSVVVSHTIVGSHSIRVCGLKYSRLATPLLNPSSHSIRVCGLKYFRLFRSKFFILVALYTSVWIEMIRSYCKNAGVEVALYTSVWIEITIAQMIRDEALGRTLYECVD